MPHLTSLIKIYRRLGLVILMNLSVIACDGGTSAILSAGISGTGIVFGSITGFGSIYVNGVRYDVNEASFNVNGDTMASQDDLKIGMVVRLQAEDYGDGTGIATSVSYDEIITGPISSPPMPIDAENKSFNVLGTTVLINVNSTLFDGTDFSSLQVDDLVEISGFVNQSGEIIATLVDLQTDNEVELHGQVTNLMASTFTINGITVNFTGMTELEDLDNGLQENLFVEVKGTYNASEIDAEKIEGEDDDRDEIENHEGEVSVQGFITSFTSSSEFSVNGIPVQVDTLQVSSTILDQLVLGLEIEVEGEVINGIIQADKIELRNDERKYQAEVVRTTAQTLVIGYPNIAGEIELLVDNESELEDELTGPITLAALQAGDEVEVEAILSGDRIRIKSLKRDDIDKYEVSGVVDSFDEDISITIDGIIFPLDAGVSYEPVTDFYSNILEGVTVVELQDEDQDSLFDEAEIE